MFCSMLIQGFPISAKLPGEYGEGQRFWYWRGASGRNYIHSIYAADTCPPLPGAVYIAVQCDGTERRAVAARRFPSCWDGSMSGLAASVLSGLRAQEIHVHLLARGEADAEKVLADLVAAERAPKPVYAVSEAAAPAFA